MKLYLIFSRSVNENFIVPKKCSYDFIKFSTFNTPACAMTSKSYDWDLKQPFLDFFFDFLKNCPYDSNEIF